MRLVKWFLGTLFTLVLLLLAAPFIVLAVVDEQTYKDLAQDEVRKMTGRELTLAGPIQAKIGLQPTFAIEDVTFSNADWGKEPELFKLSKLEAQLSILPLLSGNIELGYVGLQDGDAFIEKKSDGTLNLPDLTEKTESPAAEPKETKTSKGGSFNLGTFSLENIRLKYRDHATGQVQTLAVQDLSASDITERSLSIKSMELLLNDALAITGSASLTESEATLDVKANGTDSDNNVNVKGTVKDPLGKAELQLSATAALNNPPALKSVQPAFETLPAMRMQSSITGDKAFIQMSNLTLEVAEQKISGNASVQLSGEKPAIKADLKSDTIDIEKLSSSFGNKKKQEAIAASESTKTASGRSIPNVAFPIGAFNSINADVTLQANQIRISDQWSASGTNIKALVKEGKLTVAPLTAKLASGELQAAITLNAASKEAAALSLDITATGMNFGDFLKANGVKDLTAPNTQFRIKLNGNGDSLHKWLATSKGTVFVHSKDAKYKTPSKLVQGFDLLSILQPESSNKEYIDIACVVSGWDINNGVAKSNILSAKTPVALMVGEGSTNLNKETVDVTMNVKSNLVGFADVVPPIKVSGPWKDISANADATSTLLTAGKWALGSATGVGLAALLGEQVTDKMGITENTNPCLSEEDITKLKAAEERNKENPIKSAEDAVKAVRDNYKAQGKAIEDQVREQRDSGKQQLKDIEEGVKSLRDGFKGLLGN